MDGKGMCGGGRGAKGRVMDERQADGWEGSEEMKGREGR